MNIFELHLHPLTLTDDQIYHGENYPGPGFYLVKHKGIEQVMNVFPVDEVNTFAVEFVGTYARLVKNLSYQGSTYCYDGHGGEAHCYTTAISSDPRKLFGTGNASTDNTYNRLGPQDEQPVINLPNRPFPKSFPPEQSWEEEWLRENNYKVKSFSSYGIGELYKWVRTKQWDPDLLFDVQLDINSNTHTVTFIGNPDMPIPMQPGCMLVHNPLSSNKQNSFSVITYSGIPGDLTNEN